MKIIKYVLVIYGSISSNNLSDSFYSKLPKITVIFSDESNTHNNKLVNILLKTRIPSDISEWSFV